MSTTRLEEGTTIDDDDWADGRHAREVRRSAREAVTVAGRDAARLDAVAGAEFLDDRVRLED